MSAELSVTLNQLPIGTLSVDSSERCEFRLLESYKQAWPRPVLGQVFLDNLEAVHSSRARVPPWFSNLLPEGPLRELIAKAAGVHTSREFFLLQHLGDDLPGAVHIIANERYVAPPSQTTITSDEHAPQSPLHFSLAGVQLKLSARRHNRGFTIPTSGPKGDWIVKLPDPRYPEVPQNEYATMRWANASGITIPEVELVPVKEISGVPEFTTGAPEPYALAIRRFDRTPNGRIHMEDFAQLLNLYPAEKYARYNYETIGRLILALVGEDDFEEFLLRLIFILASGNGDAHHKNWSLVYPDGIKAKLSPAYDLVSTIQYLPSDLLALNLGRTKQWSLITPGVFRRMARKIGLEETKASRMVENAVHAVRSAWNEHSADFGYTAANRGLIERHISTVPVLNQ